MTTLLWLQVASTRCRAAAHYVNQRMQHPSHQLGSGAKAFVLRPQVGGMTCSSCSSAVETALRRAPGVRRAHVALTTQEARVEYEPLLVREVSVLMLPGACATPAVTSLCTSTLADAASYRWRHPAFFILSWQLQPPVDIDQTCKSAGRGVGSGLCKICTLDNFARRHRTRFGLIQSLAPAATSFCAWPWAQDQLVEAVEDRGLRRTSAWPGRGRLRGRAPPHRWHAVLRLQRQDRGGAARSAGGAGGLCVPAHAQGRGAGSVPGVHGHGLSSCSLANLATAFGPAVSPESRWQSSTACCYDSPRPAANCRRVTHRHLKCLLVACIPKMRHAFDSRPVTSATRASVNDVETTNVTLLEF